MPGGRMIRMRGRGILWIPSVFRAAEKESAKKLKYLNTPRMEKFNTSEKMSHFLRFVSARLGSIFCAIRKSIVVLPIINERKRQPHQPKKKKLGRSKKTFCSRRFKRQ